LVVLFISQMQGVEYGKYLSESGIYPEFIDYSGICAMMLLR